MGSYRLEKELAKADQRRAQELEERESEWNCKGWEAAWPRRSRPNGVPLECFVGAGEGSDQGSEGGSGVGRARSLTDDDLEELKACLDLGFGFTYDEIPELCKTLPALVLCYSLSRSLETSAATVASPPIANWKISGPGEMNLLSSFFPSPAREGDQPEEVKATLKFWAQAVACTVRLCS
ncbi:hypothetical protein C4D60_Mb02t07720 [Musa balbisiana]|uniref:Uncharacterized protein n=1 Tax=Musa balbisiana TaxID=52838 RepID=A0A4S8I905_MUSBA|nr:hypothetical protein C4D60_Mb02t07720 [Musa balbisiana]